MATGRPTTDDLTQWAGELERLGERLGRHFPRSEPRRRAVEYLKALCGDAERKNGWQVAEYLGQSDPTGVQHLLGRALIDRELYLPREWAEDAQRRREAGVPEGAEFATKPRPAERMLSRAWAEGWKVPWVAADEVYGNDPAFRRFLEANRQPYVLAVKCDTRLSDGNARSRVDEIASGLPARAWRRASAGDGAKGPRDYEWAARPFGDTDERGWRPWLLVRRHPVRKRERAYYLCRGPAHTPRRELVRAAGSRWAVEECFERAKKECGLDHSGVRSWHGWRRHVTLSMLALAMLSVIRARAAGVAQKGAV